MGSVSGWIVGLRRGDPGAVGNVLARYFDRLAGVARGRVPFKYHTCVDGNDLANDAVFVIVTGLRDGRWPDVRKREELWGLLAKTVYFMALNELKKARRRPRIADDAAPELADRGHANSPDLDLIAAEQFEVLLARLADVDPILAPIARLIVDGYKPPEIAGRLGCSVRKVQRKMRRIGETLALEAP